jgi:hypothetical protein
MWAVFFSVYFQPNHAVGGLRLTQDSQIQKALWSRILGITILNGAFFFHFADSA